MPSTKRYLHLFAASVALLTGMISVAALGARQVASETALGPIARMADSLAPWLIVASVLGAVTVALLGARMIALGLLILTFAIAISVALSHRALSLPLAGSEDPDLRVIFLNAEGENRAFADRIVAAAVDTGADVIVFAEPDAVYDALPRLRRTHAILTPCTFEDCPLVIASRLPSVRTWQLSLNPIWPNRYGVAELELPDGRRLFLSVAHLVKPFFSGVAEPELERLVAQYDWLPGPVLAVGDFNAAPWSRPISQLLDRTGYKAVRWPPGTWPAGAGALGIPIDNAFVHNGARIVAIEAFGGDLNSNHRGLMIDVHVPDRPE